MTVSWTDPEAALARPLSKLFSTRKAFLKGLEAMGIETVADVLRHYPRRYETWGGGLTPIAGLPVGEQVTIYAEVLTAEARLMRNNPRQRMLQVTVTDGVDRLPMTFFNAR